MIDQAASQLEVEITSQKVLGELGRLSSLGDLVSALGPFHLVALPLRSEDRLVGLLLLFHPSESPRLIADHPAVYNIILDEVGVVLQNARLLRRLVEEKRWLEAVIRHSADGILIVDRGRRVVGFNPALERMTGWHLEEVLGKPCEAVLQRCPPLEPAGKAPVEAQLSTREGRTVDVEASYAPIHSEEGEVLGGVVVVRDITARKRAQELQSTFLSIVSHELQTPISIIEGYAGLLSEEGLRLSPEQLREKLGIIKEESRRLSKMVDNLLYASRIQAGGLELRVEPLDLLSLISRVAQKMGQISAGHRIELDLPPSLPPVLADYDRVEEVLTNLLDNAIKYSPQGSPIRVEGEVRSGEVVISVVDRGPGISEAERDNLFQRFSRAGLGLAQQVKGTGLGLFICKAIVDAHGGRIWVEPAAGGGSRFRFSLPRLEPLPLPMVPEGKSLMRREP
jgi:signal transduction histidine kinase